MSVAYFQSINVVVIIFLSQDWLRQQFVGLPSLLHNLTLGEQWLTQMDEAAEEVGITIQYCTASPRHALQSVMYPSVTQASKFAGVSKGHIYGSPIPKFLENKNFTHCFPGCSPEFYLSLFPSCWGTSTHPETHLFQLLWQSQSILLKTSGMKKYSICYYSTESSERGFRLSGPG